MSTILAIIITVTYFYFFVLKILTLIISFENVSTYDISSTHYMIVTFQLIMKLSGMPHTKYLFMISVIEKQSMGSII